MSPIKIKATIDDCLKECKSRKDGKFFAYVPSSDATKRVCACYKTECLNDGKYLDHMAYEINEDENSGTNYLLPQLIEIIVEYFRPLSIIDY